MRRQIEVNAPVLTRAGKPYREGKMEDGKIVLVNGERRQPHQVSQHDDVVMEDVPIGRLLILALDSDDQALQPPERRKRFRLSCEIEQAMQEDAPWIFDTDGRQTLEKAADLVKNNFFLSRIYDAIEGAAPVEDKPRVKVKANGSQEAREAASPAE